MEVLLTVRNQAPANFFSPEKKGIESMEFSGGPIEKFSKDEQVEVEREKKRL
jgi:hypothetical protein